MEELSVPLTLYNNYGGRLLEPYKILAIFSESEILEAALFEVETSD